MNSVVHRWTGCREFFTLQGGPLCKCHHGDSSLLLMNDSVDNRLKIWGRYVFVLNQKRDIFVIFEI